MQVVWFVVALCGLASLSYGLAMFENVVVVVGPFGPVEVVEWVSLVFKWALKLESWPKTKKLEIAKNVKGRQKIKDVKNIATLS